MFEYNEVFNKMPISILGVSYDEAKSNKLNMSKMGTEIIVGQIFKPIVTTFTYDELQNYRDNNISIGINNALIFSIPQQGLDNDSSVDAYDETSIWATDNSGLLCPLSFPDLKKLIDISTS